MAHDVFISYSSRDKATADAVCATLELNGIRCWIAPRDILPSMEYAEALLDALHASRLMVLVFSSGANESPQVRQEVERAVSRGLPILPFRIENVPPNRSMEFFIAGRHWLDALTPPLEAHLGELAKTVKLLLSKPREAAEEGIKVPPVPPIGPGVAGPGGTAGVGVPGGVRHVDPVPSALPKWLAMTKDEALKHIRNAWIAGLISAAITLIVVFVSMSGKQVMTGMGIGWTSLIDVALMLGFTYGLYRKNRWSAAALLAYFILSKLIQWSAGAAANVVSVLFAVLFMYFFFQGVRGTFAYDKMKGT